MTFDISMHPHLRYEHRCAILSMQGVHPHNACCCESQSAGARYRKMAPAGCADLEEDEWKTKHVGLLLGLWKFKMFK